MENKRRSEQSGQQRSTVDPFSSARNPHQVRGLVRLNRGQENVSRGNYVKPQRPRFDVPVVEQKPNRYNWDYKASTTWLVKKAQSYYKQGSSEAKNLSQQVLQSSAGKWAEHQIQHVVKLARPKLMPYADHIERAHNILRRHAVLQAYRALIVVCVVVTLFAAIWPAAQSGFKDHRYELSSEVNNLIGQSSSLLSQRLAFDMQTQAYMYNANYAPSTTSLSSDVGGYKAQLNLSSADGVTVSDPESNLTLKMLPQFQTDNARQVDGRVIYPVTGEPGVQMVYTPQPSGLKEDIVINNNIGDELRLTYSMTLPADTEARLLPNGDIGVYSGDSVLYGDISYGSDADKAAVEKARQNSVKDNLVFTIPAPVIKEHGSGQPRAKAEFRLNGDLVMLKVTGLNKASYPLSVDPTITVNSAAKYARGNFEDNADTADSNGALGRGNLTGGAQGAAATLGNLPATRGLGCAVAYNGRLYYIGGYSGGDTQTVYSTTYSSSDGSIGGWATTNMTQLSGTQAMYGEACVAYNGYIYLIGGVVNGSNSNAILYSKVSSDGSIRNAWASAGGTITGSFYGTAAAAYNGRLYVAGGSTGTPSTAVSMGTFKADGTLTGNLSTTSMTALPVSRYDAGIVIANDHMYIFGGSNDNQTIYNTVYTSVISPSTGFNGAWTQLGNLPSALMGMAYSSFNNYIYIAGGCDAYQNIIGIITCNSLNNTAYYAQINADGSLGAWQTSNTLGAAVRSDVRGVAVPAASGSAYSAFVYNIGGCTGYNSNNITCSAASNVTTVNRVPPAGANDDWAATSNLATARNGNATVAHNGFLYAIGGCANSCTTPLSSVEKGTIAANGSVTWTTLGNSLIAGVTQIQNSTFVSGDTIYVVGGCTVIALAACTTASNTVQRALIDSTNGNLTGGWTVDTNTLPSGRFRNAAISARGYVYAIGGSDTSGAVISEVLYAPMAADGSSITAGFTDDTSHHLITDEMAAGIAVWGKYIYMGGRNASRPQYAQLNTSGGALASSWSYTTANPSTINNNSLAVNKGYLYVSGGAAAGPLTELHYGKIDPSTGDIASFTDLSVPATGRFYNNIAVTRDYIYITGGCTDTTNNCSTTGSSNLADYARLENGGSAYSGAFTADAGTGTAPQRVYHTVAAIGGYLYVISGCNGTTVAGCSITAGVSSAPISDAGTLGTWATTNSINDSRIRAGTVVYNGKIYVIGGCKNSNCNSSVNAGFYTQIGSPSAGAVTWVSASSGNAPADEWYDAGFAAYDGYVYRIGGNVNNGTIAATYSYATLSASDTSAWTTVTATSQLTTARSKLTAVAYNGYVYAIGGQNSSGADLNTIEVSKIQANHTLGAWTTMSARIPTLRTIAAADIVNGMLVVAGGRITSSGAADNSVQAAAINSDGTIGNFSKVGTLNTARSDAPGFFYNGKFYATFGVNTGGSTVLANVERGSLEIQPRKGNFSILHDTDLDSRPNNFVFRGSLFNSVVNPITYAYAMATSATPTLNTAVSTSGMTPESLYTITRLTGDVSRYYWFRFSFDDSQSAGYPDSGNRSYMTNYDMYFQTNSARRLRNGKTFTNEIQNNLDAHP